MELVKTTALTTEDFAGTRTYLEKDGCIVIQVGDGSNKKPENTQKTQLLSNKLDNLNIPTSLATHASLIFIDARYEERLKECMAGVKSRYLSELTVEKKNLNYNFFGGRSESKAENSPIEYEEDSLQIRRAFSV